jgi:hypothetical protein
VAAAGFAPVRLVMMTASRRPFPGKAAMLLTDPPAAVPTTTDATPLPAPTIRRASEEDVPAIAPIYRRADDEWQLLIDGTPEARAVDAEVRDNLAKLLAGPPGSVLLAESGGGGQSGSARRPSAGGIGIWPTYSSSRPVRDAASADGCCGRCTTPASRPGATSSRPSHPPTPEG